MQVSFEVSRQVEVDHEIHVLTVDSSSGLWNAGKLNAHHARNVKIRSSCGYQVGGDEDAALVLLQLLQSFESLCLLETGADEGGGKTTLRQHVAHTLRTKCTHKQTDGFKLSKNPPSVVVFNKPLLLVGEDEALLEVNPRQNLNKLLDFELVTSLKKSM